MTSLTDRLHHFRDERISTSRFRTLPEQWPGIDFSSNDYLGLARSPWERDCARILSADPPIARGSTGSRLLTGNSSELCNTEQLIARYHHAEAALLFPSCYQANIALLSCLPGRGDTILLDEYAHASLRDGARLSAARKFHFRHSDLDDLKRKATQGRGTLFIVVESTYSMEGDSPSFSDLIHFAQTVGATLIVDEAHSVGLVGPCGNGWRDAYHGLSEEQLIRTIAFGKAFGLRGGGILCSSLILDFLINSARAFIYSTAPSPLDAVLLQSAYERVRAADPERAALQERIQEFCSLDWQTNVSRNPTQIQFVSVPGSKRCRDAASALQSSGLDVRAILSPTVPAGKERLRVNLHSFNSSQDLSRLFVSICQCTITGLNSGSGE